MRYPAAERLEIIWTVEMSPLPVRRMLAPIGIPKSTCYSWLDRHAASEERASLSGGAASHADDFWVTHGWLGYAMSPSLDSHA